MNRGGRLPPRVDGMISLKVDNLAYRTSIEDLREADVAIRGMDGRRLDGREIRVQRAKYGRPNGNRRRRSNSPRRNGRRSRSYSSDRDRRSPKRYNNSPYRNYSRSTSRERF